MLRLLEAVPQGEDEATVALAFQSLQLVAADCMPSLPPELLATVLSVASLYASQQVILRAAPCMIMCRSNHCFYLLLGFPCLFHTWAIVPNIQTRHASMLAAVFMCMSACLASNHTWFHLAVACRRT